MKTRPAPGPVLCALLVGHAAFAGPLVITDITVIDATGAAAKAHMTVTIRGDRIAEIDRRAGHDLPRPEQRSVLHSLAPLPQDIRSPHLTNSGHAIGDEQRQQAFVVTVGVHVPQARNEEFPSPVDDLSALLHPVRPV